MNIFTNRQLISGHLLAATVGLSVLFLSATLDVQAADDLSQNASESKPIETPRLDAQNVQGQIDKPKNQAANGNSANSIVDGVVKLNAGAASDESLKLNGGAASVESIKPNAAPVGDGTVQLHDGAATVESDATDLPVPKQGANIVNGRFVLQGGVEEKVPKTPEDVAKYLEKMKSIMNQYEEVATTTLMGSSGLRTDLASIETAKQHTFNLIKQINATVPPAELKDAHMQLAKTMGNVGEVLGGGIDSFAGLGKAFSLVSEIHSTMNRYHDGVSNCIAYYKLSPSLDPFGDSPNEAQKRFLDSAAQFTGQKLPGGAGGGDLNSLLGGSAAGGMPDLGAMMKMMGGMTAGGASAPSGMPDLGAIMKMMGAMSGGAAGSSPAGMPDLGSMMKMMSGMTGGGILDKAPAPLSGPLPGPVPGPGQDPGPVPGLGQEPGPLPGPPPGPPSK